MKVVVLTGGPCGGKTSTLQELKKEFGGEKILIVPEPATMLMSTGFPAPGRDLTYSQMWQHLFQNAISPLHLNMEEAFKLVAEQTGAQLIICDRGILDGAAYFPGGLDAFLKEFNLDKNEVYARYDCVIHLESTATCRPALFGKAGNQTRYESLDEAIALEHCTREAWQGHPNWRFISGAGGLTQVIAEVISIISEYLDVEIERKFWITRLPSLPSDLDVSVYDVLQGYIIAGQDELRIRRIGNETYIAAKSSGTLQRDHWERPLPKRIFEQLWPQTENMRVSKVRYLIPYGPYTLELDVYDGPLQGLITLECEFPSKEAADTFVLPDWLSSAVEVTNDAAFKNKNLALHGLPSSVNV